ncbi:MAG: hypothetical protein JXQ72_15550 [Anaerolineae bacterium]|nr:hypothetical protein [Anaerolineae bacterium]
MRDVMRLLTTLLIWVFCTGIIITSMVMDSGAIARVSDDTLLTIITITAVAATLSTVAVWLGGHGSQPVSSDASRAKTKRHAPNRIERLIEALDDDEIYDLEALLLAREDQGHSGQHGGER